MLTVMVDSDSNGWLVDGWLIVDGLRYLRSTS